LQYLNVPTSTYTAMNQATASNGWTVEAIFSTTHTGEQYIFDPRNDVANYGMGFGISSSRPATWARAGDATGIGTGGSLKTAPSGPTIETFTWNHIAWVKLPTDASNIYMYLNGQSCGSVPCGTNATTTQSWTNFVVGTLTSNFYFRGRIGGVRVSNVAPYFAAFSPPDCLMPLTSSTFCLGPNRTDLVTGLVLSKLVTTGDIEQVAEVAD